MRRWRISRPLSGSTRRTPPGNESKAAEYVKGILEREGIPAKLLALDPKRANLVAQIRGNGSKKPLLVMGHTDVVGVQKEKWSVDPFAAVRKEGYIWGGGPLDAKGEPKKKVAKWVKSLRPKSERA